VAAFEAAARLGAPYQLHMLGAYTGSFRSSAGVALAAASIDEAPTLDTLIVSGGDGARRPEVTAPLIDFVEQSAHTARRIASVCTGSYILAAAGVLDGRRATTHWSRARGFARRFPKVSVDADRIFIRDGSVWTSAGVTAGIDLSLALIAEDAGETIARLAAQQLVVYYRRPGGQSQFSALLQMAPPSARFSPLMGWMREHLHEDLSVGRLADRTAMSARNFCRAFTAELGVTPARAVERLRIEAARERIEGSHQSIERVAADTGFGNPERMRRAFIRAYGYPPQSLRRAATRSEARSDG
jgi:transcriptional regulator GlxA family with amidase domain